MIAWEVEPHIRMMVCPAEDLLKEPNINLTFGPIFTSTHQLAHAGWELGMVQRTPRHIAKTRPKIWLAPPGNRNQGFKIRPRACYAYQIPEDVFYDLRGFGDHSDVAMTLSKFETKTITVTREVVKYVEVPSNTQLDPFDALKTWCDDKVASMELPVPKSNSTYTDDDPSATNVINLIDHLRRRDQSEVNEALEARLQELFA